MKNIKKILCGLVTAAFLFSMVACSSDIEDDDELTVKISVDGNDEATSRSVSMSYPSAYDGKPVYIVYTLDGSDPVVEYDASKYSSEASMGEYFDYGTALLYEKAFSVSDVTTIKAKAFYINGTKAALGPVASATIKVKVEVPVAADTGTLAGSFGFTLASSGNSNITHYFDTSASNVFKWGEYEHCYYQIQFSYKGSNKGNWYLFVRQIGRADPIPTDSGVKYIANGTYAGGCFNSSKGNVSAGTLSFKNGTSSTDAASTNVEVSGDSASFTLTISGDSSSSVAIGS